MKSRHGKWKRVHMCVQSKRGKSAGDVLSHQPASQAASATISTQRDLTPDTWTSGQEKCSFVFVVLSSFKGLTGFLGFNNRLMKVLGCFVTGGALGGFCGRQRDLRPGCSQGWPDSAVPVAGGPCQTNQGLSSAFYRRFQRTVCCALKEEFQVIPFVSALWIKSA